MDQITYNNKPLSFIKYERIDYRNPKFVGQTTLLDGGRYISIWYVELEDRYYACIA